MNLDKLMRLVRKQERFIVSKESIGYDVLLKPGLSLQDAIDKHQVLIDREKREILGE